MSEEPKSYVGLAKCGCVRFAAVDMPSEAKSTRKAVMDCLARGLRVEMWETEAVRQASWGCDKCRPAANLGVK